MVEKISKNTFQQELLEFFLKQWNFLPKIAQTGSHRACQFVYRCFW